MALRKNNLASALGTTLLLSGSAYAEEPNVKTELKTEVMQIAALKRVESMDDIAIPNTAVSVSDLGAVGIEDLSEIPNFVPSLTSSEVAINTNIYIRCRYCP